MLEARSAQIYNFLCEQDFIAVSDSAKHRTLQNALRTQKRRFLNVLEDEQHRLSPSQFERIRGFLKDEDFIVRLIGTVRQDRAFVHLESWHEAAMRQCLVRRLSG